MSKQEQILNLLIRGKIIRRMDGRCDNGYVDKQALETLIAAGRVTVFERGGMDFVKAKKVTV
jgi:hypothetical protein